MQRQAPLTELVNAAMAEAPQQLHNKVTTNTTGDTNITIASNRAELVAVSTGQCIVVF